MRTTFVLALAACTAPAQTLDPTSRGPRADQHLAEAREHEQRAEEMTRWPEARRNDVGRFDDPNSSLYYVPWELDTVEQQRWRAGVRRGEVGQIYAAFDEACANVAPDRVRVSPLRRDGIGGTPTADGVIVLLDPDAGAPERVLAELRCHRAWMMLSDPGSGESESPLDLPNLQLQAYGDRTGVSVDMRVTDRTLVAELQRRAASELEAAAAQRRQATR